MKPIFSASLMCMSFLNVEKDLHALSKGCNMFHADVMDGHFAKNLSLSPDFIRDVKSVSNMPIDVHLMVENPEQYIETLIEIGVDYISLHLETINVNAFRLMRKIKEAGVGFGLVMNPATPLEAAQHLLSVVDLLTIMTVDVGYAGQAFIPQMLDKIKKANDLKKKYEYSFIIQVDGACGPKTYNFLWQAGAVSFVVGTSGLFGRRNTISASCALMREEFTAAVEGR